MAFNYIDRIGAKRLKADIFSTGSQSTTSDQSRTSSGNTSDSELCLANHKAKVAMRTRRERRARAIRGGRSFRVTSVAHLYSICTNTRRKNHKHLNISKSVASCWVSYGNLHLAGWPTMRMTNTDTQSCKGIGYIYGKSQKCSPFGTTTTDASCFNMFTSQGHAASSGAFDSNNDARNGSGAMPSQGSNSWQPEQARTNQKPIPDCNGKCKHESDEAQESRYDPTAAPVIHIHPMLRTPSVPEMAGVTTRTVPAVSSGSNRAPEERHLGHHSRDLPTLNSAQAGPSIRLAEVAAAQPNEAGFSSGNTFQGLHQMPLNQHPAIDEDDQYRELLYLHAPPAWNARNTFDVWINDCWERLDVIGVELLRLQRSLDDAANPVNANAVADRRRRRRLAHIRQMHQQTMREYEQNVRQLAIRTRPVSRHIGLQEPNQEVLAQSLRRDSFRPRHLLHTDDVDGFHPSSWPSQNNTLRDTKLLQVQFNNFLQSLSTMPSSAAVIISTDRFAAVQRHALRRASAVLLCGVHMLLGEFEICASCCATGN